MGRFTQIPKDTFDALQLDAGVLLYNFDVELAASSQSEAGFEDKDFICSTTGGIEVNCSATYSDLAEDVDNAPNNMKEFKHLDGWDCTVGFTSLSNDEKGLRLSLGAADIDATGTVSKVVPRRDLEQTDFSDIWWVGDKANGGFVAIKIINALSNEGFSLKTEKNGKGQTSVTLMGHVSINAQRVMPMEFYSIDAGGQQYTYQEVTPVGTENPSEEGWYELVSGEYVLSTDTTVDDLKTYYERVAA